MQICALSYLLGIQRPSRLQIVMDPGEPQDVLHDRRIENEAPRLGMFTALLQQMWRKGKVEGSGWLTFQTKKVLRDFGSGQ